MDYQAQYDSQNLGEQVIRTLAEEPATRNELCELLDVSRTTLGRALSDLLESRSIRTVTQPAAERGRPAQKLELARNTVYAIGMDISRRRGIAIATNRLGETLAVTRTEAEENSSWEELLSQLCHSLSKALEKDFDDQKVAHVGIGIPVPIGHETWRRRHEPDSLVNKLKKQVGIFWEAPILVDNTIRMAALGEARWGAGQNLESQLYVRISRGITSCATIHNVLTAGADGYAGEIGHMNYPGAKEKCHCGQTGCIETIATEAKICERAGVTTLEQVREALENPQNSHHQKAKVALKDATDAVALACANATFVINPAQIVLAGAVPTLIPQFTPMVAEALQARLIPSLHENLKVVNTSQNSEGAARGAIAAVSTYLQQKQLSKMLKERHAINERSRNFG
ncbi:hypothetical protein BSR29_00920 [Boudabousia liubingyangii]|uniref:HVO-A0261-like N-terminal domain-containing protein n=1 Tax=Boudabousia liubingyangii TaxID=1921764 RepID=A0A1Q5PPM9_9ACTO|nr:ROK family transcriptional regulator [Boudabousia liubingyangii]OKL49551.1 hypothetical protein BSR29_00920 [Boudabousia liubingyangii]